MAKTTDAVSVSDAVAGIDFSQVRSMDDALAMLNAAGIIAENITEYGDGFILLPSEEKHTLKNVPFIVLDGGSRTDAATGRDYFSFRIVTNDGRKLIVNDGSAGLARQASEIIAKRGSLSGLVVLGGLSGGEYTTTIDGPKGPEVVKASTFYFAGV